MIFDLVCTPEIITLVWTGTDFTVTGSVTGSQPNAALGVPYTVNGVTFTPTAGTTAFVVGDTFHVEVKTPIFNSAKLFVKLNGVYRTLSSASAIITETISTQTTVIDTTTPGGVWEVPPQLENNVQNETRATISQGDLYYHLTSIIDAQPGLTGYATGQNNWRQLTHDLGVGGKIKQYDGDVQVTIGQLLQEKVSPATIIEFARQSYESVTAKLHNFITEVIPEMLTDVSFTPPTSGDGIDQVVIDRFKTYFAAESVIIQATPTVADDQASTIFYDTTSPLSGFVVTLPYLGLIAPVEPAKVLDLDLNLQMMRHHDGHLTALSTVDDDVLRKIVTKLFTRYPGQQTPGQITGTTPPAKPYKGQFWYKTSTRQLFFYNVVSDHDLTTATIDGQYTYIRDDNTLYHLVSGSQVSLGSSNSTIASRWTEVKLDLIEQNLLLAIETELYEKCPSLPSLVVDHSAYQAQPNYQDYLEAELGRFGLLYRVPSVYGGTFDPDNAFTWNYSSEFTNATWQKIYLDEYGTQRPDLQPWIPGGYLDENDLISALQTASLISLLETSWTTDMWTYAGVPAFIMNAYTVNGITAPGLAVNTLTGELLPPYSLHPEALTNTIPTSLSDPFVFGDEGPVELYWRKTLNFLYSQQKVYYKLNPVSYLQSTWQIHRRTIGDYTFHDYFGRKVDPHRILLHGDQLPVVAELDWLVSNLNSAPGVVVTYVLTYVSQLGNRFNLEKLDVDGNLLLITSFSGTYSDTIVAFDATTAPQAFNIGDRYTIHISATGVISSTVSPAETYRVEGFNQLFVQYFRAFGEDVGTSIARSLVQDWAVKLGYRAGGLINTDATEIKFNAATIVDPSSYNTFIKENRFNGSRWLNALRVQLVRIGSTTNRGGYQVPAAQGNNPPGEDWVFRIDNFNQRRPELSWYEFDMSSDASTFVALDGVRAPTAWVRPKTPSATRTIAAPFLITGLQNTINFLFGYSDKLTADGWSFNDQDDPELDPDTGRPLGFQLLIEQFIVQQFSNPTVGSAFTFNPFSRRVWFRTKHGVLANLDAPLGLEQETVAVIFDANQKQLSTKELRVFRDGEVTELVFDRPVYTLHALISEFEHTILFEAESGSNLIYDQFLGQRTPRLLLKSERTPEFTGRIDFGGRFLLGDQMKRNIESSVSSMLDLYASSSDRPLIDAQRDRARAQLGYERGTYFDQRGSSDETAFRFWRGMIHSKGTNFAVDAFLNSAKYQNASIDEMWAYRLATYGDGRTLVTADLRVEKDDSPGDLTGYRFINVTEAQLTANAARGYDVEPYDDLGFDGGEILDLEIPSQDDYLGIYVSQTDEARWNTYDDLQQIDYLKSDVVGVMHVTPSTSEGIIVVVDDKTGLEVRADCFIIEDLTALNGNPDNAYDVYPYDTEPLDGTGIYGIHYEGGDLIPGSDPVAYSSPFFERINSCTIRLLTDNLVGKPLRITAYGPAIKRYSPIELYDYVTQTKVRDDVIFWDPARGSHHPEAMAQLDYISNKDPARYNNSRWNNTRLSNKLAPWGVNEVGKLWWATNQARYRYYHDVKLNPSMTSRLGQWGSLVDDGDIDVFEWVESDSPPSSWSGDGVPLSYVVNRNRTWSQRIVGWRYTEAPGTKPLRFLAYQPTSVKVTNQLGASTAVLRSGTWESLKLSKGVKLAGANYSSSVLSDANVVDGFGLLSLTGDRSTYVTGTSGTTAADYDGGPNFASSVYVSDLAFTIVNSISGSDLTGSYVLSTEIDATGPTYYLRLTHAPTGNSQQLPVHDTPIVQGTQDEYSFDRLNAKLTFNNIYGWTDNWPSLGTSTTPAQRIAAVAIELGNPSHDIVVRSSITTFNQLVFSDVDASTTVLTQQDGIVTKGWIAWKDPETNPAKGPAAPFNKFEPLVMSGWTTMTSTLQPLVEDVKLRTKDLWTWNDTSVTPYLSTWSDWDRLLPAVREKRFYTTSTMDFTGFFTTFFTFTDYSRSSLISRMKVYVNGTISRNFTVTSGNTVIVNGAALGDLIRITVAEHQPTKAELAFDPEKSDPDPLVSVEWKRDYLHSLETLRDGSNAFTIKKYYFWVRNRGLQGVGKRMSAKQVAKLLKRHDGLFAAPQLLKYYDQVNATPIGYGMLWTFRQSLYVGTSNRFMYKITYNPSLRQDEEELDRKNYHEEWTLISKLQSTKIPKALWDALTDTLCGQTYLGEALPFLPLESYDARHGTSVRYGLGEGRVLTDPGLAKAAVKYIIANTRLNKYVDGQLVPDYISYSGFNVNQLDTYLSSATNIRKFMADLWLYATSRQVNEIFFEALDEAAAKQLNLNGIFKTSFISISDIQTI